MDNLTEPQKQHVLERRAQFVGPAKICAEWKVVFPGTPVPSPQSLATYDASKPAGEKLSPEHKALFWKHREAFLSDRASIGLAHPNYRLQALQDLLDDPVLSRNPEMVKDIVEMAEKIDGGMYQQRVTAAEAEAHAAEVAADITAKITGVVDSVVTDPSERERVHAEVKKLLEG